MIRVVGPVESAMYKKWPATSYVSEPSPYFSYGPQVIIDAYEEYRKKAAEFIKSPAASELAAAAEECRLRFEAAKKAIQDACDLHCKSEIALVDWLAKVRRDGRMEEEKVVRSHVDRFYDRNWVDEKYGGDVEEPK